MRDEQVEEENAATFRQVMAAGTLGLAMAVKAVEIFDQYLDREQLTRVNTDGTVDFDCRIPAPDGPVFTAILEAANECRGVFDDRPPEERRWDALLQLIDLAAFADGIEPALARTQDLRLPRSEPLRPSASGRPSVATGEESAGQSRPTPISPKAKGGRRLLDPRDRRSRATGDGGSGPRPGAREGRLDAEQLAAASKSRGPGDGAGPGRPAARTAGPPSPG
jgi:hypothetical protein